MNHMSTFVFASVVCLVLTGCATSPHHPENYEPIRVTARLEPWHEPDVAAYEQADENQMPAPGQVLFIGSSSIRMWDTLARDMAPVPSINRGFGGSRTPEVLAVFDRIVRPYHPSVIVYYCGDNDLGNDNTDSQAAADGFIAFDQLARQTWPEIQVIYIPIKPSLARWQNWDAMLRANELVRQYCERTDGASYVDTVTPTLTDEGRPMPSIFMPDGLHLNAEGYEIWTAQLRPAVHRAWKHASRNN